MSLFCCDNPLEARTRNRRTSHSERQNSERIQTGLANVSNQSNHSSFSVFLKENLMGQMANKQTLAAMRIKSVSFVGWFTQVIKNHYNDV